MFSHFFSRNKATELPMYSCLRQVPTQSLPQALLEREQQPDQRPQREKIQQRLLAQLRQVPPEQPLFTALMSEQRGMVTIPLPNEGKHCLPVFTSPYRASDYRRMLLATEPHVQYLASNVGQFLHMLQDLEQVGISNVVVDRCPRCDLFTMVATRSFQTMDDAQFILATTLSMQLQRADLYFAYAVEQAQKGQWDEAQLVALETVGHVTLEDARIHLLIGMLALARLDRPLLQEVKAFLAFLGREEELTRLTHLEQTGSVDFTIF